MILEDPNVGKEEVDQAIAKLQKAVDGLKKSETSTPGDKDQGTSDTNTDNTGDAPSASDTSSASDVKAVKTGDAAAPIGWIDVGFAAMLAAVCGFFGRRKRH